MFEDLTHPETIIIEDALTSALRAMAHFGNGEEEMAIIASLLTGAMRANANHFKDHEQSRSEEQSA